MTGKEIHEVKQNLEPYLCSQDVRKAVKFYMDVLGGCQDSAAWEEQKGRIGHSKVRFDDYCVVKVSDVYLEACGTAPPARGEKGSKAVGAFIQELVARVCRGIMCLTVFRRRRYSAHPA